MVKKLFLDANILVAVINKEYPLFSHAARIFSLADRPDISLFTSPVCLSIAFYFAEKKSGNAVARKKIKLITDHVQTCTMNHAMVAKTLDNKKIHDFEDGLEYYAAKHEDCHYIITEDKEDFYFSEITVKNAADFLMLYLK